MTADMRALVARQREAAAEQATVDAWNAAHPVGTPVVAYPCGRPEDFPNDERIVTTTRSKATVLGGHTAVVWVHGHSACIALTHVDVRTQATPGEAAEYRHLLYDADSDASVPAFPYPTAMETSR
ncbi:hypothetical protein [Streptomyces sp. NPDC002758]